MAVHGASTNAGAESNIAGATATNSSGLPAVGVDNAAAGSNSTVADGSAEAKGKELRRELRDLVGRRTAVEAATKIILDNVTSEAVELFERQALLGTFRAELSQLEAAVSGSQRRAWNLNASLGCPEVSAVELRVRDLLHHGAFAATAGLLGLLSVVGPSSYTRLFFALIGSATGGLMVVSSSCLIVEDLKNPTSRCLAWPEAALRLLGGECDAAWYYVWAGAVFLGGLRWFVQWDRRDYDFYWPSQTWCCFRQETAWSRSVEDRKIASTMVQPMQEALRGKVPASSMASVSSRLPPMPPPPALTSDSRITGSSLRLPPLPPAPPLKPHLHG